MIRNRNLERGARKRVLTHVIDISAANVQARGMVDAENDIRILRIDFVYSVATDSGTVPENIQIGTAATAGKYFAGAPSQSQALGTVQAKTVASTDLLPAGTALIINKSAATGGSNTGEVTVCVYYERVDKDSRN